MDKINKLDMSRFWAQLPSRDVEETKQRKQLHAAPAVHIGTVSGDVFNINTAGGSVSLADLKRSRAAPREAS